MATDLKKPFTAAWALLLVPLMAWGNDLERCELAWVNPLPQGDRIRALTWGDNEYLAIAQSGIVQRSADGRTWTLAGDLGEIDNFKQLSWDGSRYLVLGTGTSGATPRVYHSPDGETWTGIDQVLGFLNDSASNGSRWVFVGNNSNITYSDDLQSFEMVPDLFGTFVGVVWTGTQFVAIARSNQALTSPNGIDWTPVDTGVPGNFQSLEIFGTKMVAAGFQGAVMTSDDGFNWTAQDSGSTRPLQVYHDGVNFLAVGDTSVLISSDGENFSPTAGQLVDTQLLAASPTSYVAYTSSGSPRYSTDLSSWENTADSIIENPVRDIASDGSQLVAVSDGGQILVSPDGIDWSIVRPFSAGQVSDVDWDGQQFYVVGNSGAFYTSPDALTWTDRNPGGNEALFGGVSANNGFVGVGASGTIIQSPDGQTWQARDSGTTGQLNSVAFSGSEYVAVGESGVILRSGDGIIWSAMDSGTTRFLQDVVFAQQQFVVAAPSGVILTSPDGAVWTPRDTPTLRNLADLDYRFGRWLAVGEGVALTSPDAVTWTLMTNFPMAGGRAAGELPDTVVYVGDNGSILGGSCDLFRSGFETP